jgi:hypothetical protein
MIAIGMKFGRLLVLKEAPKKSYSRSKCYKCRCNCGKIVTVIAASLTRSRNPTKSCGCLAKDMASAKIKHGYHKHPLYNVWVAIKQRCYNSKHPNYSRYGGRGIKCCKEWKNNPEAFINWSLNNSWKLGLEIERLDNDRGYTPSNCAYVTRTINVNNRNNTVKVLVDGKIIPIGEAVRKYSNLPYHVVKNRYDRGETIEQALEI